ncbi:15295_t:CDS:2, partial [Dentiscutata erythropus]
LTREWEQEVVATSSASLPCKINLVKWIFKSFYRSLEELKENLDPDSEADKKVKKLLDSKKVDKKRVERLLAGPKVEEVVASPSASKKKKKQATMRLRQLASGKGATT